MQLWLQSANDPVVVHLLKTRFMQEQGHLLKLSKARLALFRVFCLPTIAQQTIQNFIWIFKVDPALHNSVLLQEFISFVQMYMIYNNTYIVASNSNFSCQ
jgi:hypothetical protein